MKPVYLIGPLVFMLLGFLLWMNFTPGSFRECACKAEYLTELQEQRQCAIPERTRNKLGVCYEMPQDGLLIFLSYFDFYK